MLQTYSTSASGTVDRVMSSPMQMVVSLVFKSKTGATWIFTPMVSRDGHTPSSASMIKADRPVTIGTTSVSSEVMMVEVEESIHT